ncbi:MAG: SsrA-binding protein SmpB [Bacteroidia bacterium]|nr:SsrA-binding protein SmpB [Bacteroidia bacterium]
MEIKNKKALFLYELFEHFIAGILLTGTEIKSIRAGKVSFTDSYCFFKESELWIKSLHISEYSFGGHYNHEPKRDRKLLLTRHELKKLENKTKEKGFSIIPVRLFIAENGFAKVEIALAKGRKMKDKRENIRKREIQRDIEREINN